MWPSNDRPLNEQSPLWGVSNFRLPYTSLHKLPTILLYYALFLNATFSSRKISLLDYTKKAPIESLRLIQIVWNFYSILIEIRAENIYFFKLLYNRTVRFYKYFVLKYETFS